MKNSPSDMPQRSTGRARSKRHAGSKGHSGSARRRLAMRTGLGATALSSILIPGLPAVGSDVQPAPSPRPAALRLPEPTRIGAAPSLEASADSPQPLAVVDVTSSEAELVADLVRGAAAEGVAMDPDEIRVVHPEDSPDHLFVLPENAVLVTSGEGEAEVAILPATTPAPSRTGAPRSGAFWKMIDQGCLDDFEQGGLVMRTCWWDNVLMSDPDSSRTWRSLQLSATASPVSDLLKRAELTGRTLHPNAQWSDWSPKSDYTGGCQSTNVSVSAFGVSVGQSSQQCEIWDITLGSNPQWGLKNSYQYNGGLPGSPHDREVALAISVTVPQSSSHQGWYVIQGLEYA